MKRCPKCLCIYTDETLKFCRDDGAVLVIVSAASDSDPTIDLSVVQMGGPTVPITSHNTPSIAVLPFVHMSADPDDEYFCDGLAEELLNALAKIEHLKVAARTSAFSFKGKNINISQIGEALNVSTVLEGSVRKSGGRLRITAQLIDVSDGYHLWSERYDRQMEDVFDIQDEITLAIIDALKVKLLGEEKAAVLNHYTDDPDAYEAYLKGRYFFHKFTAESWDRAVEYFEESIRKEPEYAAAYAGIALCWNVRWYYGHVPPHEIVPKWKAAASRALKIDNRLGEAHLSMANIQFYYDWDKKSAEREFRQAVELNPNSADAHWCYGMFLASIGEIDHAINEGRRALEIDPLSLLVNTQVGWLYWLVGKLDDVLLQARKIMEIEPNFFSAHWLTAGVHVVRGMHEESIKSYNQAVTLGGGSIVLSALGCDYGVAGREEEARDVLNQLLDMRKQQYVPAFDIARVYMGLSEIDLTFEWLEKACEERNGEMVFLDRITKVRMEHATWEHIRQDPRFPALLDRAGLKN